MNRVTLIGRLTKDPELRQTSSGIGVATFTLAVDRRGKDKQTDFFNIVCWRVLADNAAKYLGKGDRAGVHGSLQTRSYDAQDGTKRYVTEIVADEVEFLETKKKEQDIPFVPDDEDMSELPF